MKKYILWLLGCLVAFGARAQVQLGQETFEGLASDLGYATSPNPTFPVVYLDPPGNTVASQYFQRIQQAPGSPYTPWSSSSITLGNQQGNYFWGLEGVRGDNSTIVRPAPYIQFNDVNTANYINLQVKVAFSAPRGTPYTGFGRRGVKRQDQVRIEYSFDGTNWLTAGRLTGDDASASNSGFWKRDANLSGDASDDTAEPVLNQAFTDYTFTIPDVGGTLRVRIIADYATITATELAFDNVRILGTVDTTPRPVLALDASENGPVSYNEGDPAVRLTNTLAVTYPGGTGTLTGATVRIQSGYEAGQDVLGVTPQGNISVQSNANGLLQLTGSASVAAYQAVLRTVTYQNTNTTAAIGGARGIVFRVSDNARSSNTASRTVNVTAVLNGPSPLPYTEDFETNGEGTRYTATAFENSASLSGFFRATSSPPVSPNGVAITTSTFTGYNGTAYWFADGTKTLANPTYPVSTLRLAPVDATGFINLRFTLRLGRGEGDSSLGWEDDDYVRLYYRTSSTGTWTLFGAFYGNLTTGELRRDANLDGTADANGTLLTSALQDVVFGDNTAATPLPNSLAVAALEFKIEMSADEELAFDYIRITGVSPPLVTTAGPVSVTSTGATLGGEVVSASGGTVSDRGVLYSTTNSLPTVGAADVTQRANGTGPGAFSQAISGLTPATTYYVRAYATNAAGTGYGVVRTFTTPTTVSSITRVDASPTNASSVRYTVTFANAVTGGAPSNFSLSASSSLSGSSVTTVAGTGTTRTVTVNTGTGSGSLTLTLANSTGLSAPISNAPFAGPAYVIDKDAPTTAGVGVPANGTYTVGQVMRFTVNFSETVLVTGTPQLPLFFGPNRRPASYVGGTGTTALSFEYTVQAGDNDINGITLAGSLALNGGTIRDAATNDADLRLNGVPTTTGILVDAVAPTVTNLTGPAASGSTVSTAPFNFSVTFSEIVTNFSASGITVTNGTVTSGPSGTDDYYTFTVTPTTPGTPTTVTIAAGAARDAVGYPNAASATYSLTYLPPNVTVTALTGRTPTPTATATVTYQVTFSGDIFNLGPGNFSLTTTGSVSGASVAGVSGSGARYLVTVNTGTGDGTLRLNVSTGTGTVPGIDGLPVSSGSVYTLVRNPLVNPNPQLAIQGAGSASGNSDVTAFVDAVQVLRGGTAVAGAVQNGSFETNNVGTAGYQYSPQVSAAPWTFGTQAGVARNGSAFAAPPPPQGDAVALLQSYGGNTGRIAQKLALAGGNYQINLQASQRNCCGTPPRDQVLYVLVGGVCVGEFQPTNTGGYEAFTSVAFSVRAPSRVAGQLLRFAGSATPGYADFSADATNPAPILGTRYTQTAWIKPNIGTGTALYYVLGNGTSSAASPYVAVTGDGRLEMGYGNGSVLRNVRTSPQTVPANVWSHVAATYDGSYLRLYLNGELQVLQAAGVLPVSTPVNYVGSVGTSGPGFFPGDIDEVSQWTRALSQAEIRQLRHLILSGAEDGLASYLQFNDGGTTTTDFVTGTVGTLTGATRPSSTAPVGTGTSSLVAVTGAGTYPFTGTNMTINFTVPGTPPYDVVVSRLEGSPLGTQPTAPGLRNTYPAYWIVNRYSPDNFAATVTYQLGPTDISAADAASAPATLRLFKRGSNDDGAFDTPIPATAANAPAGTVSFPVTSFSQTVIGTLGTSPLPVELVSFTAEVRGDDALLRWATAQELGSAYFDVEASPDGRTFQPVGQLPGHGTSTQPQRYQLLDPAIARYATPRVYYRLRQVDLDGRFRYSEVRVVNVPGAAAGLHLFPNPAPGGAATLTGAQPGTAVAVYDALGRRVATATADAAGTAALLLPAGLPAGVYVVRCGNQTQRLAVTN